MLKTLPFNALRTLEAVVRLRGFRRAADELNVTQSAVSQHVRLLEDWLGHRLLIRTSAHSVPTEHGERLARAVREGFGGVEQVCDALRDSSGPRKRGILVAAPPGFAFVWLLPRLLHFDERHPDIPVSLSTDPQSQNPVTTDADVVIAYGIGGYPGRHAEKLMSEAMAPVCAPELAQSLGSIADLARHPILHDTADTPGCLSNWELWAEEVGVTLPPLHRTRRYGQANLVIQAAINGAGVAMGRRALVEDAIARGALVHPFPHMAQSRFSYWFVCSPDAMKRKPVQAFRAWIQHEAAA